MPKAKFPSKKVASPAEILKKQLLELISKSYYQEILPNDVPSKWEKHGDLVLLPSYSFQHSCWQKYGEKLWDIIATVLKAKRVARKHRIKNNDFRSPCVELLRGDDGWVTHIDNKIKYVFDITKCMFSAGNISEKLRIAKFSCDGETVVDLYAGIGYFTLPFLIHARASVVHSCEWNPDAVAALERTLAVNGVKEKCVIHFGDNREVCPEKIADRVNLGLIPSSEGGWAVAGRALKTVGGVLHVHGNITSSNKITSSFHSSAEQTNLSLRPEWAQWSDYVCDRFQTILSDLYNFKWKVKVLCINHVKSYAPHIDHLVVDIECRPDNNIL